LKIVHCRLSMVHQTIVWIAISKSGMTRVGGQLAAFTQLSRFLGVK
jgi:hypothetical protein